MRITITWFDGSQIHGRDWAAAERRLRAAQWSAYPSKRAFRKDMRHRVKVWTGKRPDLLDHTSEEFLRALETGGLCRIDTE